MSANYSTIKVVCEDSSHSSKTVNVAEYDGWGTNWSVNVVGRRKSLVFKTPNPKNTRDEGFPLWPTGPNSPAPPTFLRPLLSCRLCRQKFPERALDPAVMHPVLNRLAGQGVSRLTLRQLVAVVSQT